MQAVLRNEFFTLTVDTLGAEAVSLKNAAGEEVLWQADPEVWPRHAPILFPWTGELPQSSYSHKGKTYHVVKQGFAGMWSTHWCGWMSTRSSWNCGPARS